MKKFLFKLIIFVFTFLCLTFILVFSVPKDENSYLCEYNYKVDLLKKTKEPRIIFIGGSSVAFGTDSKSISDSLKLNTINLGMDAGMGIKVPTKDCLQFVRRGDIIVLQFEYENFYKGGDGEGESIANLLYYTDYRRNLIGIVKPEYFIFSFPYIAIKNLRRIVYYLFTRTWEIRSLIGNSNYVYSKSGFNEYGDEIGHYNYPSKPYIKKMKVTRNMPIDKAFTNWLSNTINDYEQKGTKVIMLPPVCIKSHFERSYSDAIRKALDEIGHPYIYSPKKMVLEDKYAFDSDYHVNKEGVNLNTQHIIESLRFIKKQHP